MPGFLSLPVATAAVLLVASQVELWALSLTPELDDDRVAVAALAAICAAAIALRRSRPVLAAGIVAAGVAVQAALVEPAIAVTQIVCVLLCIYSAAAWSPMRPALAAWAAAATAVVMLAVGSGDGPGEFASILPLTGAPFVAGRAVGRVRAHAARLEALTTELERERERGEQLAVQVERARLARELHDVVAHGVGVMTMQAAGGARIAATDPQRAAEVLATIEASGRDALNELQRVVTLLRDREGAHDGAPPGLDQVPELVDRFRGAGLDVALHVDGALARGADGVGLAAYRVVQEALTNAFKHAPGSRVRVELTHEDGHLAVVVADSGGRRAPAAPSGGHGLVGIRERVELCGGDVSAGPADGGFRVEAHLPA